MNDAQDLFSQAMSEAQTVKRENIPEQISRLLVEISKRSIYAGLAVGGATTIADAGHDPIPVCDMAVEYMGETDAKFAELAGLVLVALERVNLVEAAHA